MTRNKARAAAYLAGVLAGIIAIVWAESEIWSCVNYLRNRAETISSDGYHLSDHLEAKVREINDHSIRYLLQPDPALKSEIQLEHAVLLGWINDQRGNLVSLDQREMFVRFEEKLKNLWEHVSTLWADGSGSGADAWRSRNEKLLGDTMLVLRDLAVAEKAALALYLEETRNSMTMLYRRLAIASVVLLSVGAGLALFIYQGFVAPLRLRLKETRLAMQQQEKLTSLGVLAAGVAHEIRNPLTSIKARLFTQKAQLSEHTEEWEDNVFITEEISRLERIVRDFLAFARPSEPQTVQMQVSEAFRDLDTLVRRSLEKANISLVQDLRGDGTIRADPQQLKQVLLNLVQNAAESIGTGGTITLRTRIATRRLRKDKVAVLEVEDTGKGIAPEVQKRLFDPFFTTKPNGTGLGLSIAARILEKHGGTLEYHSERNRGTTFRVVLPLVTSDERNESPPG